MTICATFMASMRPALRAPTWDNVGVQYGLRSLQGGNITINEFLHLNWNIGGWKHPSAMVQEGFPFFGTSDGRNPEGAHVPGYFDPWSRQQHDPEC